MISATMKVKVFNCYNEDAEGKINLINTIKRAFNTTDIVLSKLKEMNQEILDTYIITLKEKLNGIVKDFELDLNQFELESTTNELGLLREQSELQKAILRFFFHSLALPADYNPEEGEVTILYSNEIKTGSRFSYHRVKTLVELLGKEQGSELYKKIVPDLIKEMKKESKVNETKNPKEITLNDQRKRSIETWCRIGLVDFTVAVFDDYKVLYRFDKCGVHEALKEFPDPDIAYLASCYSGDVKEFNEGKVVHMRRTQTLHHGAFCDELYWNNIIYKDTEQPSLAFTESLKGN
ncbi:MAG: L-2-amino-thiazoline-4-carboxylic acid hydrolase [Candidatus Hodarchaeota archaeon]